MKSGAAGSMNMLKPLSLDELSPSVGQSPPSMLDRAVEGSYLTAAEG